jgi:hypothetical protein
MQVKATLVISALIVGLIVASVFQTGIRKQSLATDGTGAVSITGMAEGESGLTIFLVHDRNNNGIFDIGDEVVQQTQTDDSGRFFMKYQPPFRNEWTEVWQLMSTHDDVELQPNGDLDFFSSDLDLNEEIVGLCFHRVGSNQTGTIKEATLVLTAAELEKGYCAVKIQSGMENSMSQNQSNSNLYQLTDWTEGVRDSIQLNSLLAGQSLDNRDSLWLWLYPGEGLDDRDALAYETGNEAPSSLIVKLATPINQSLLLVPDSKELTPPVRAVNPEEEDYRFFQKEKEWSLINCTGKRKDEQLEFKWTTRIAPGYDAQVALHDRNGELIYSNRMKSLERSKGSYDLTISDPDIDESVLELKLKIWDSTKTIVKDFQLTREIKAVRLVKIGPNPLRDEARLSCVTTRSLPVRVYDLTGNLVADFPSGVGYVKKTIPTMSWRKGTYILKIGDDEYKTKLVKI